MTGQPLTTIIITNYNYGRFLGRAIDSALSQTYSPVEVIVVDDGSTDDSRSLITRYGNRISAVFQPNGGNAAAYNAGFGLSRGEIVLFLDSDDALYPDAIQKVVAAWRPGTIKVQFYLDVVDANERPLGWQAPNVPFAYGSVLEHLLDYGYYPSPPTSGNAYARSALARVLPAPEAPWRMGIDGLLNGIVALYGDVVSIDDALGIWRHHDRNHSEASGTDLGKIRRDLLNECNRESALKQHASALGRPISRDLSLRIPSHCKGRLLSLRLGRHKHPFPEDRITGLVVAGIAASWRFPHHRLGKRLAATLAFPFLGLAPRVWLAKQLDVIIMAHKRPSLVRNALAEGARLPDRVAALTHRINP